MRATAARPATIDEYLQRVSPAQRAALQRLRRTIKSVAPQAEECISYQLAAFRLDGLLVGFGASGEGCAFYLMSGSTVADHSDELAGYDTSKGTIRFPADKPLPTALVRKLVEARLTEKAAARRPRGKRQRATRPGRGKK